ncbi:RmlD substrate binding domain protein [Lentilactobacillus kisonensis F0435]|uniref:dTDP-4-dehydrorhamnose reductase n=1 Tax=Lentilactobacillus kisonensis F0435 TaxID=797516 RepID=H1LBQ2_9LACO|nr:RmlD substrate binding domain protein [Lentilactobacillus kisonensis F0435]
MKKYMITGAQGQLGTELSKLLHEKMLSFQGYGSTDLDITNRNLVFEKVNKLRPDVIFHCAAYTAVDDAEDVGKKTNWKINVDGTKNIIDASKKYMQFVVLSVQIMYLMEPIRENIKLKILLIPEMNMVKLN